MRCELLGVTWLLHPGTPNSYEDLRTLCPLNALSGKEELTDTPLPEIYKSYWLVGGDSTNGVAPGKVATPLLHISLPPSSLRKLSG